MKKLIEEVEKYGKELYEYSVEEYQHPLDGEHTIYEKEWAGTAIVYEYADKNYEIITWNENSRNHEEGEKTIKQIN
jgi:hypothetical protein